MYHYSICMTQLACPCITGSMRDQPCESSEMSEAHSLKLHETTRLIRLVLKTTTHLALKMKGPQMD